MDRRLYWSDAHDGVHAAGKKISTKEKRWYKDVGLGFKTPAEAIHGSYVGASL